MDGPINEYREITGLDRRVHEPTRLAIMAALSSVEDAEFTFLQNLLGLTQGNLASHLKKLEEAGYVEIRKSFKGRKPNTSCALTDGGERLLTTTG